MYKSYFQKNGITYALDKTGKFNTIKTSNNIEEILIAHNCIEELENLLKDIKEKKKINKVKWEKSKKFLLSFEVLSLILILLPLYTIIEILGIMLLLISSGITISKYNNYSKTTKEYENKQKILKHMISKEKFKLNILEKNARPIKNDIHIKEKTINFEKKRKELHKKLELISFVSQNISKINFYLDNYGEDYLKNDLSSKFSIEEINYIINLINLYNKKLYNKTEKNKVKTYIQR